MIPVLWRRQPGGLAEQLSVEHEVRIRLVKQEHPLGGGPTSPILPAAKAWLRQGRMLVGALVLSGFHAGFIN
jgi:hypothetical protein